MSQVKLKITKKYMKVVKDTNGKEETLVKEFVEYIDRSLI